MRISDWSSDVCSSDLAGPPGREENIGAEEKDCGPVDLRHRKGLQGFPQAAALNDGGGQGQELNDHQRNQHFPDRSKIGRASCRERVGQSVAITEAAVYLKKNSIQYPYTYPKP